jgi:excisionase family DNA binding protein
MKTARPSLSFEDMERPDALLTTGDVARLLRVHPKHVYRLLRRGMPAHRIGGEWRFRTQEVLTWAGSRRRESGLPRPPDAAAERPSAPPPLLAANGDVAVEHLLARLRGRERARLGFVQSDRVGGLELLGRGEVIAAGCHGGEIPRAVGNQRLAFIHLVDRQVGLATRRDGTPRSLRAMAGRRLASRPTTAGVRVHFDEHLRRAGADPDDVHGRATLLPSHLEVVCAVARGEADVGLSTAAWAHRVGLDFLLLYREPYGLLVRATLLGDPRIVALCEVAQSAELRRELGEVFGYGTESTGRISYLTGDDAAAGHNNM